MSAEVVRLYGGMRMCSYSKIGFDLVIVNVVGHVDNLLVILGCTSPGLSSARCWTWS